MNTNAKTRPSNTTLGGERGFHLRIDSICRYCLERDEMEFVEDKQETDRQHGIDPLWAGNEHSNMSQTAFVRTNESR